MFEVDQMMSAFSLGDGLGVVAISASELLCNLNQSSGKLESPATALTGRVPIRVRQITDKLNYSHLVQIGTLPSLSSYFQVQTKRYKAWIYKQLKPQLGDQHVFAAFGLFMDGLVRKIISDVIPVDWGQNKLSIDTEAGQIISNLSPYDKVWMFDNAKTWRNHAYDIFMTVMHKYQDQFELGPPVNISTHTFNTSFSYFDALARQIVEWFGACAGSSIQYNQGYVVNHEGKPVLAGHPDIVTINSVIDIKTSVSFKKISDQTFLQLLAYVAIMRANGLAINYAGVLLPLQIQLIMVDLSGWNSQPFLDDLISIAIQKQRKPNILAAMMLGHLGLEGVGKSIATQGTLFYSLQRYYLDQSSRSEELLPVQIFLEGSQTYKGVSQDELQRAGELVRDTNLLLYVHAPYRINPWRPWTIEAMKKILIDCKTTGARGVTIHTVKTCNEISAENALNMAESNIRSAISYASQDCPLLLETPVGAGTELLWQPEEFASFYHRFKPDEKELFKVCIDTCHVFVAGYHPDVYLETWVRLAGWDSIGLIHFNDSRNTKGCHADGHAPFGLGNIDRSRLIKVRDLCLEHGISMVTE